MPPDTHAPYEIVLYPDPILKKRARPLTPEEVRSGQAGDVNLHELARRMIVTMEQADGLGLAGPQVGISLRVFTARPGNEHSSPFAVLNPVLNGPEGKAEMEEGCLSLPGIKHKIKRAERLVLTGLDLEGRPMRIAAAGLEARIYQHEVDHLDGTLILQRMGTAARFLYRQQLRELEDRYELRKRRRERKDRV
jgi:peptide deformylase